MHEQTVPQYVVVGAGAAGSIVAGQLAQAGYSVLLLETGPEITPDNAMVWDPARWNEVLADESLEFGFVSTPQKGLKGSRNLLQSKGTGGCQIHNAMVYVRGGQSTYDYWANTLGCSGWDYQTLLPFFNQVEATIGLSSPAPTDFTNAFQATAAEFGLPYNENYNGGATEYGCVPFQFTVDAQPQPRRATAFQAYIADRELPSLTVLTGCTVQQLIVDRGAGAPTVQYVDANGTVVTVQPSSEVILSAGAIATPAILLRSGIGPALALKALGIRVDQKLPGVGQNFYDDLGVGVPVALTGTLPGQSYGYLGIGAFATADGVPPGPQPGFGEVNLELQISTTQLPGAQPPVPGQFAIIGVASLHLKSRGTVTLARADPNVAPVVDPNWLSHPGDLEQVLSALQLAVNFATDPDLAAAGGWTPSSFFPQPTGPGEPGIPVEAMIDWIQTTGATVQHYVGSCAMGPPGGMAVVDPSSLGVYGVPQLRIIDASVAPTPVTGNTAGVSMVIGAKGASLVIADAARPKRSPSGLRRRGGRSSPRRRGR